MKELSQKVRSPGPTIGHVSLSMKGKPHISKEGPGRNDPCPCGSGRKYKLCCAGEHRLLELQDEFVAAHYRRGLVLESRGREDDAIEAYSIAAASGQSPDARSRLGHIFTNRGMAKAASDAFRAAAANATTTDRRLDLVRALMIEGKPAEAEAETRRAIELDPGSADGFWLLGRVLSEAGRFAEARTTLERAIALEPRLGVAYYDLVRACRIGPEDRPLVEQMLRIVPSLTENDQRIRMHLALGKALDDLGEFGEAMRHFENANQIKRTLGSFDRAAFSRRIDGFIERFSAGFIAAHARDGDASEVPVLIVGMPRSGTTLVEQIISSHSEVSGGGEMPFWTICAPLFDKAKDEASVVQFLRRTAHLYLAALHTVGPTAKRVTDKDPFNFLWAALIHLTFPRATIIHCRRDPIDTCLSVFSTYFRRRPDFSTDREDLVFYHHQYQRLTAHWRNVLPPSQFYEVDYEALVARPEEESRRLIAACGLDWQEQCLRPQDNQRVVNSASKWQARQPIHRASIGRWRRYEPWIGALQDLEVSSGRYPAA